MTGKSWLPWGLAAALAAVAAWSAVDARRSRAAVEAALEARLPRWRLVYVQDGEGRPVEGRTQRDHDSLCTALERGAEIRVAWKHDAEGSLHVATPVRVYRSGMLYAVFHSVLGDGHEEPYTFTIGTSPGKGRIWCAAAR